MAELDIEVNKDLLSVMMLRSLPESYQNFRCAIASRDDLPDLEILRVKIIEEFETRREIGQKSETQSAMVVQKQPKRKTKKKNKDEKERSDKDDSDSKLKCFTCHGFGHKAEQCPSEKKSKEQSANRADDVNLLTELKLIKSDVYQVGKNRSPDAWCVDSGCTSHMCSDRNVFGQIDSGKRGNLNLASSNASTENEGRGVTSVVTSIDGREKNVHFSDTLYVPNLRTNLVSVGKITDRGYKVIFDSTKAETIDVEGNVVLAAERDGGLYYVKCAKINECKKIDASPDISVHTPKDRSFEEWHVRLGHLNVQSLREAIKSGAIRGLRIKDPREDFQCQTCIEGKMSRMPFPKSSKRESKPGDIIHSNVCGSTRVRSNNGRSRFFVTFIDDYSGWCEVKFLAHKNEVLGEFEKFRVLTKNQHGKRIKYIQSDNGTEYINTQFNELLEKHGIKCRLTVPHNPQQNGRA